MESNSTKIAKIATRMAICDRKEEEELKRLYKNENIQVTAVNIGGNYNRASNQNIGGKIGIARGGEHISVCIFLNIGLLHLDEVVIGIGHRSLPL